MFGMIIRQIKKAILDTIFPIECLGCGVEGEWLCNNCLFKIRPDPHSLQGEYLDRILTFYSYDNEIVKRSIHLLKYKNIEDLALPLGEIFSERLREKIGGKEKDILVVPVPLYKRRLRERGYNQAELLAGKIAEKFLWQTDNEVIERVRATTPQVDLEEGERRENIRNAFAVGNASKIKDRKIIIIDDVLTTGATMEECARVMKDAGAKEVWGIAFAKG